MKSVFLLPLLFAPSLFAAEVNIKACALPKSFKEAEQMELVFSMNTEKKGSIGFTAVNLKVPKVIDKISEDLTGFNPKEVGTAKILAEKIVAALIFDQKKLITSEEAELIKITNFKRDQMEDSRFFIAYLDNKAVLIADLADENKVNVLFVGSANICK